MCVPSMVSLVCLVIEKLPYFQKFDIVKAVTTATGKALHCTYGSPSVTFVAGKTKITEQRTLQKYANYKKNNIMLSNRSNYDKINKKKELHADQNINRMLEKITL